MTGRADARLLLGPVLGVRTRAERSRRLISLFLPCVFRQRLVPAAQLLLHLNGPKRKIVNFRN